MSYRHCNNVINFVIVQESRQRNWSIYTKFEMVYCDNSQEHDELKKIQTKFLIELFEGNCIK